MFLEKLIFLFKPIVAESPSKESLNVDTNRIVSYLSSGNVLLQNGKFTTQEDTQLIKKEIFEYFDRRR